MEQSDLDHAERSNVIIKNGNNDFIDEQENTLDQTDQSNQSNLDSQNSCVDEVTIKQEVIEDCTVFENGVSGKKKNIDELSNQSNDNLILSDSNINAITDTEETVSENVCDNSEEPMDSIIVKVEKNCNQSSETLSDSEASEKDVSEQRSYICAFCKYRSASRGNYDRHVKAVHGGKKFSCGHCPKAYSAAYDLREHIRVAHQNERLLCEICSKVFNGRKVLNRHKALVHMNMKQFICPECGKQFYTKDHFDGHVNSHFDTRPYQCPKCSKSYGYKNSLQRHMITCTGPDNTEERVVRYACDQCGKVMKSASSLRDHVTGKHSSEKRKCQCGKEFMWRTSLIRHQRKCMSAIL